MTFGQYLKNKRKAKGLTQEQVGEALNVSKASVSKYEQDLFVPQVSIMKEYRELLGVSRDEFYAALEGDVQTDPEQADQKARQGGACLYRRGTALTPELLQLMQIAAKNRIEKELNTFISKIGGCKDD